MKKKYFILLFLIASTTMSAQLVINEILYDPYSSDVLGDANRDGVRSATEDDFIELVNTGATTLDIGGYRIYEQTAYDDFLLGTDVPRHVFPSPTNVAPGQVIVVFSGSNDGLATITAAIPSAIFQVSSTGFLDLLNSGPAVYILDSAGTIVDSLERDDTDLQTNNDYSVARKSSITDAFVGHLGIDQRLFSPGEQVYFTDTFGLIVNEILYDGNAGDTNEDGAVSITSDEFIEFYNNSGAPVDISGYKIFDTNRLIDNGLPRHTVPASTIIPAEGVYLLFGGGTPGSDTGSTFGGSTVDVSDGILDLNNADDNLFVLDASDNLVLSLDFASINLDLGINQSATRNPQITGAFALHEDVVTGASYSPGIIYSPTLSTQNLTDVFQNLKIYKSNNSTLRIEGLQSGKVSATIINMLGKEIVNQSFIANGLNEIILPQISPNIYIIKLQTTEGLISKKIILN